MLITRLGLLYFGLAFSDVKLVHGTTGESSRFERQVLANQSGINSSSHEQQDSSVASIDAQNITQILNSLVQDYDKRLRPNYGGKPVEIEVTIHVSTISAVSEVEMDYTLDIYLRQYWQDPRLRFWGINHSITVGLTVTLNCPMNLEHFPMDKQHCCFEIESYGYSTRDIQYAWRADEAQPLTIGKDVHLAQFRVSGHDHTARAISLSTGNYSRLTAFFTFERNIGFYLIQIYLPSSLIVIISWVSFWLNREATQARVAIGVTTVLTMTTLMTSTNASMPKVSYVKSIDIYLGTCFIIVFASLLEYAAVGYLMKRMRMQKERKRTRVYGGLPSYGQSNQFRDRRLELNTPQNDICWTNEETGFCQISSPEASPSSVRRRPAHSSKHTSHSSRGASAGKIFQRPENSPMMELGSFCGNSAGKDGIGGVRVPLLDATNLHTYRSPVTSPFANKNLLECDCEDGRTPRSPKPIRLRTRYQRETFKPSSIDKYSRVLFPLVFVSFHIIYWTVYLNAKNLS